MSDKAPPLTPEQVVQGWDAIGRSVRAAVDHEAAGGSHFTVQVGSSVARDDAMTDPFQTSHLVAMALGAAYDHLHAIVTLIQDANALHTYAPFTLARAALENSAVAFWLVHPSSRPERLTRTFRLQIQNIDDSDSALAPTTITPPRSRDERRRSVKVRAEAAGLDLSIALNGRVPATSILRYADENVARGGALFAWQLCSGFAHGRSWASLGALEREEISRTADGVITMKTSASLEGVLYPVLMTAGVLRATHERLNARCVPPD